MLRQSSEYKRNSITYHLADLLRRDINVAYDVVQWLEPHQREIDRRSRPKRIASRYVAASIIVSAAENPAFARELLDRTEGKVADVVVSGSFNDLVRTLEAGRARLLAARQPQQVIEGHVITPQDVMGLPGGFT
jgi:hypothetical protein